MARETITKLIDDIDGGEAAETVTFGLDGATYEIDLSAKNAAKLRKTLEGYAEHGTRVGRQAASARGRMNGRGRSSAAADREQNRAIREWAAKKKLDVAPRGRIKAEIIEQYHREAGR